MTVAELIRELEKYPGDEPIFARDLANCNSLEIMRVAPYDDDEERGENWALAIEFDSE